MKKIITMLLLLGVLLLAIGCKAKSPAIPGSSATGEVITADSTLEVDQSLQEVDDLSQMDQETQSDISFDEFNDVDVS